MKITSVRSRRVTGTLEYDGETWEDGPASPLDWYADVVSWEGSRARLPARLGPGRYRVDSVFIEIETDEGMTGRAGPIAVDTARIVNQFKPLLLGQDSLAGELLWDAMYRAMPSARSGAGMLAISAIDNALWDVKGQCLGQPIYRVLGGPTRRAVEIYASGLGYSLDPARVRERTREFRGRGYRAIKWSFHYGPVHGRAGMAKNLKVAEAVREAAGPHADIMFDAVKGWDVPYTLAMAERLKDLDVRWLEEPVLPDRIASYAAIRRKSPIPIAGGEAEYSRWGIKALLDAGAVDVLQPDVFVAGGITELVKMCTLASVADHVEVIPHSRLATSAHVVAAQAPDLCPMLEDLMLPLLPGMIEEFFLKDPPLRRDGTLLLPQTPGLGMQLDDSKIETNVVLNWDS